MSTRRKVLVSVSALLCLSTAKAADSYENFSMPKTAGKSAVGEGINYSGGHFSLKSSGVSVRQPRVSPQEYLFAKEAFVSDRRDETIRLLRQQIDSGYKQNLDNMLLQLGQAYAEKYMEIAYYENEYFSQQIAQFEKSQAKNPKAERPAFNNRRSQNYLHDATAIFYSLEKQFPNHHKMDEISFFLGFVELENGKAEKGVKYLERVLKFPNSRKYDEALLYLGDYYFDKHKFGEAANRYRALLSRKDSYLIDYAHYKLAWCNLNLGNPAKGLADMKALVSSLKGAEEKGKFNLREQALKDLVAFYGEADNVEGAMEYFIAEVGKEKATENLKLIADILRSKAKDAPAVQVYNRLIDEYGNSIDGPRLYVGLYEALSRLGKTSKAVDILQTALERFGEVSNWAGEFPSGKSEAVIENRDLLRDTATKAAFYFHQSAQRTAAKQSYDQALALYGALVKQFPNNPERKKLQFYQGEILFSQGKWIDASDAYMAVAEQKPKDKLSEEAAYNAILAVDKLTAKENRLERYTKDSSKNAAAGEETIPDHEKKFLKVADYFVSAYPSGEKVPDVYFRKGAIFYQYRHFEEAMTVFKDLVTRFPKHKTSETAAHLVLDIYNIRKDYDLLNKTALEFAALKDLGDEKFKSEMRNITDEIDFKKVESFEKDSKWADAGKKYLDFYKRDPKGKLAEQSLYNAFIAYQKTDEMEMVDRIAMSFRKEFPKSEYAAEVSLYAAKFSERRYDFEESGKRYLYFAQVFPNHKEANKALYNAAVFSEILGDSNQALKLYENYIKKAKPSAAELKAIHISEAKMYRKAGNWAKVASIYRGFAEKAGSTAERLDYLAELARQYEKAGKEAERKGILKEVLATKADPKKLKGAGAALFAEARFGTLDATLESYRQVKLKFPAETLIATLKKKKQMLTKLDEALEGVAGIGVPEWGVAALSQKAEAFELFGKAFTELKIPDSYKGDNRTEAEVALKKIEEELVNPVAAEAKEIAKLCAKRAAEFSVASAYASKCRAKAGLDSSIPTGIYPQPSYWSTRWVGEG